VDRAREVTVEQARQARQAAALEEVSAEARWPSKADGMVRLAESFLADNPVAGNGGERYQVMVHLDQEALGPDGALGGTLEDGTRVSAETCHDALRPLEGTNGRSGWWSDIVR
jgi:hypothetical protein